MRQYVASWALAAWMAAGAMGGTACGPAAAAPGPATSAPASQPISVVEEQVNGLVHQSWTAAQVTAAPAADDPEFLRRVMLDLVGRVPTRQEASAYFASADSKKKEILVDKLLASPDYAEHMADVYMTLLVGRSFKLKPENRDLVRGWLVESFQKNGPYDKLTTEILADSGQVGEHGEIGFIVSHAARGGSPEAVAGATARVFLGLQIQCAQCHDHPYDKRWKQEDFYGLVAFFARTRGRLRKEGDVKTLEVFDVPFGQARMKKHGTTDEVVVKPRFLGHDVPHPDADGRRNVLARDIVGSDLFAKAAVNRAWEQFFGRGILDPVDDLGGENDPSHPPLLVYLAQDFMNSGYDLRHLYKVIALSDAYAESSRGGTLEGEKVFARAAVRPLEPEQLFASLLSATGIEAAALERQSPEVVEKRLDQGMRQFVFIFGDDEMGEVDRASGTVPQALLLFNGQVTNRGALAQPGSHLRAILDETKDPTARLNQIYLTAFSRSPSADETARALPALKKQSDWEDLFAMLTSTEFSTNH